MLYPTNDREIERPTSPKASNPSSSSYIAGQVDAQRFNRQALSLTDGSPCVAGGEGGALHAAFGGNGGGNRRPTEARGDVARAEFSPNYRHHQPCSSSGYSTGGSTEDLRVNDITNTNDNNECKDDGDDGLFGPGDGDIGSRGSYREDADPDDEEEYDDGDESSDEDDNDDDEHDDEDDDSFFEDSPLLSGNSSDWTPLRGADLVATSPPSRHKYREWFVGSSGGNAEVSARRLVTRRGRCEKEGMGRIWM